MKTSNKLAIIAIAILLVLPAASFYVNNVSARTYTHKIMAVIDSLQTDSISILQYNSPKASPGLLYVTPTRKGERNTIVLNIQPEVRIAGDTLVITSDDPGAIYQGHIHLRGLHEARFNQNVRTFHTANKVPEDTLLSVKP